MLNQRFDAGATIPERFGSLGWRKFFDLARSLQTVGVYRQSFNRLDVSFAVVTLVGADALECFFTEDALMFLDCRQQGVLVLHPHVRCRECDEKVAADSPKLKHSTKLMRFAQLSLFDAGNRGSVKRKPLSRFDRMRTHEMANIQQVTPALLHNGCQRTTDMPRQRAKLTSIHGSEEINGRAELFLHQIVIALEPLTTFIDRRILRQKEVALRNFPDLSDIDR